MKRLCSVILTIVMLFSVLALSSCDSVSDIMGMLGGEREVVNYGEEIEDINGKTPEEVLDIVLNDKKLTRYDVKAGINYSTKVLFYTIQEFTSDYVYVYSIDGENRAIKLVEGAAEKLAEAELENPLGGECDEVIFIDGVCYEVKDDVKQKYAASEFPYTENICEAYFYPNDVKELFSMLSVPMTEETEMLSDENASDTTESEADDGNIKVESGVIGDGSIDLDPTYDASSKCYRTPEGGYCIVATSSAEMGVGGGYISYAIYLDESCTEIEKITMDVDLSMVMTIRTTITYQFIYDDLDPIANPDDAELYETK